MHPRRARAAVLVVALLTAAAMAGTGGRPAAGEPTARRGCTGTVALTFDDGPAAGPTGRLVDILRRAHAPATFFMVGERVAATPALARRVERAGFLVGNHSWAHVDMTTQTSAQVAASLRVTETALRRAGVHPTDLMRPPYGALDAAALDGIRAAHLVPVLWTIDPRDWESGTAGQIAQRILGALRPGPNIVLQHDGVGRSPISVDAVPMVISGARRRGYCLTALDEAGRPGFPTPDASVAVTSGAEGGRAVVSVSLSKPAGRTVSVRLRARSGSADVGSDLPRLVTRLRIPAGRLSARVRVPLRRDGLDERTERFHVRIARPRGTRVADATGTAQVLDRDRPPLVRGQDATVTEPTAPDGGPAEAVVQVPFELSRVSGRAIRIVVATRPGTATADDFVPTRTTLRLPPGSSRVTLPVTVLADTVDEDTETFTVEVVRRHHVREGRVATVTIEPPPPAPPEGTRQASRQRSRR